MNRRRFFGVCGAVGLGAGLGWVAPVLAMERPAMDGPFLMRSQPLPDGSRWLYIWQEKTGITWAHHIDKNGQMENGLDLGRTYGMPSLLCPW